MTTNQLIRHGRTKKRRKVKAPAMEGHPQLSGTVIWVGVRKPKKPNSANRHLCKVRLSTGREVSCYIPGENGNVQEHSQVLVRGGRVPDLPGVKYHLVRGSRDFSGENCIGPAKCGAKKRNQMRSKYGVKRRK